MNLHFLLALVFPEPAVDAGGRRGEGAGGMVRAGLIVEFVAFEVIFVRLVVRLTVELERYWRRGFPRVKHASALLHVIFDFYALAGHQ